MVNWGCVNNFALVIMDVYMVIRWCIKLDSAIKECFFFVYLACVGFCLYLTCVFSCFGWK